MLVVEDDPSTARALLSLLRIYGYEAAGCATVRDGIASLSQPNPPATVILDLMLPDGTGESVLQFVRDQNLPVRVVVCTATAETDRLAALRRLRADAVLTKPVNLDDLLLCLKGGSSGDA